MSISKRRMEMYEMIGQRDHLRSLLHMEPEDRFEDFRDEMTTEEIEMRLEAVEKDLEVAYGITD